MSQQRRTQRPTLSIATEGLISSDASPQPRTPQQNTTTQPTAAAEPNNTNEQDPRPLASPTQTLTNIPSPTESLSGTTLLASPTSPRLPPDLPVRGTFAIYFENLSNFDTENPPPISEWPEELIRALRLSQHAEERWPEVVRAAAGMIQEAVRLDADWDRERAFLSLLTGREWGAEELEVRSRELQGRADQVGNEDDENEDEDYYDEEGQAT